jgi:hypothetical protein
MTTNQTIDGVPREKIERALDAIEQVGYQDKFIDYTFVRAVKQELRALLDAPTVSLTDEGEKPPTHPDPMLCKFYDVTDWPGLVCELVGHVAQLQDSAKRNVKPWEDTFPPTLLPAYIERVNAANESAQAHAYRLLGDGDLIEEGDETLNDDTATWGKQPPGIFLGMPYNRRVMLPVRRAISK